MLLPAVYLLAVVQYSGLTFPFWDETDLLPYISDLYTGHLSVSSLWAPHNQSRPLTLRILYVLNARLTRWDLRSEFVFLLAAIYATFALQLRILWHLTGRRLVSLPFAVGGLLLSIVVFSPAGHMNHWWSFMLQLDLAALIILYALWRISRQTDSWRHTLLAALAVWLATYTLTNGLVAAITVAVADHVSLRRPYVGRRTVFWVVNTLVLFAVYLPGIPRQGPHPDVATLIWFAFIYLGSPLFDLIHYPFHSNFDVFGSTWAPGLVGIGLVAIAAMVSVRAWQRVRRAEPAAIFLLATTFFAVGSALVTGWGRANFDQTGVASATQSRYTIFAAFLLYGLIHYGAARASRGEFRELLPLRLRLPRMAARICGAAAIGASIAAASLAYVHGVRSYTAARNFNDALRVAYSLRPDEWKLDGYIYAYPARAEQIRGDLLRLHIGPYRDVATRETALPTPNPGQPETVRLAPGDSISESFVPTNRLVMLSLSVANPAPIPTGVVLKWSLLASRPHGGRHRVAGAEVTLDHERSDVNLVTGDLGQLGHARFTLVLSQPSSSLEPLDIVVDPRPAASRAIEPVVIDGKSRPGYALSIVQTSLDD
jgi:hypothetical protein